MRASEGQGKERNHGALLDPLDLPRPHHTLLGCLSPSPHSMCIQHICTLMRILSAPSTHSYSHSLSHGDTQVCAHVCTHRHRHRHNRVQSQTQRHPHTHTHSANLYMYRGYLSSHTQKPCTHFCPPPNVNTPPPTVTHSFLLTNRNIHLHLLLLIKGLSGTHWQYSVVGTGAVEKVESPAQPPRPSPSPSSTWLVA